MDRSRYQRLRVVGTGTYGCCYLVNHKGKHFIEKSINLSDMRARDLEETKTEIRVLQSLRHPYIISYRDSFIDHNELSIIMDFADGGDLYAVMKKRRPLPFKESKVLKWFTQICLALKHIHEKNILHRDLKSQNIFLQKCENDPQCIKVGDFGIARVLKHSQDFANTRIGTPYYLSPEICLELPYNSKTDIWAVGCVLYELLTFNHAFNAPTIRELCNKITCAHYAKLGRDVSTVGKDLIALLLQKDPNARPSCESLLRRVDLQKYVAALHPECAHPPTNEQPELCVRYREKKCSSNAVHLREFLANREAAKRVREKVRAQEDDRQGAEAGVVETQASSQQKNGLPARETHARNEVSHQAREEVQLSDDNPPVTGRGQRLKAARELDRRNSFDALAAREYYSNREAANRARDRVLAQEDGRLVEELDQLLRQNQELGRKQKESVAVPPGADFGALGGAGETDEPEPQELPSKGHCRGGPNPFTVAPTTAKNGVQSRAKCKSRAQVPGREARGGSSSSVAEIEASRQEAMRNLQKQREELNRGKRKLERAHQFAYAPQTRAKSTQKGTQAACMVEEHGAESPDAGAKLEERRRVRADGSAGLRGFIREQREKQRSELPSGAILEHSAEGSVREMGAPECVDNPSSAANEQSDQLTERDSWRYPPWSARLRRNQEEAFRGNDDSPKTARVAHGERSAPAHHTHQRSQPPPSTDWTPLAKPVPFSQWQRENEEEMREIEHDPIDGRNLDLEVATPPQSHTPVWRNDCSDEICSPSSQDSDSPRCVESVCPAQQRIPAGNVFAEGLQARLEGLQANMHGRSHIARDISADAAGAELRARPDTASARGRDNPKGGAQPISRGARDRTPPLAARGARNAEDCTQPQSARSARKEEDCARPLSAGRGGNAEDRTPPLSARSARNAEDCAPPLSARSGRGVEDSTRPLSARSGGNAEDRTPHLSARIGTYARDCTPPLSARGACNPDAYAQPLSTRNARNPEAHAQPLPTRSAYNPKAYAHPTSTRSACNSEPYAPSLNARGVQNSINRAPLCGRSIQYHDLTPRHLHISYGAWNSNDRAMPLSARGARPDNPMPGLVRTRDDTPLHSARFLSHSTQHNGITPPSTRESRERPVYITVDPPMSARFGYEQAIPQRAPRMTRSPPAHVFHASPYGSPVSFGSRPRTSLPCEVDSRAQQAEPDDNDEVLRAFLQQRRSGCMPIMEDSAWAKLPYAKLPSEAKRGEETPEKTGSECDALKTVLSNPIDPVTRKEVRLFGGSDSASYRIERLRVYLEETVGLAQLMAAYRHLQHDAKPQSLHAHTERYLPMIHQLLQCEAEYYS